MKRHPRRDKRLLAAAALAAVGGPVWAQAPPMVAVPPIRPISKTCAPAELVSMVVRDISPGVAAADARAQPRAIWRQGEKYFRNDEAPDLSRRGTAGSVIVSEPDIWTFNQSSRQGQHGVDPGPNLDVHAPILPVSPDLPAAFRTLEFGCEAGFITAFAPRPIGDAPWGPITASAYGVAVGDQSVAILMDPERRAPLLISYSRQGRVVFALRYDAYQSGLADRPELFQPPKDVVFSQSATAKPTPKP